MNPILICLLTVDIKPSHQRLPARPKNIHAGPIQQEKISISILRHTRPKNIHPGPIHTYNKKKKVKIDSSTPI
jgi:hypothetical protein